MQPLSCPVWLKVSRLQQDRWRLSTVNGDYSVCPSYPPAVIVPKDVDDATLRKVAKFRQGGRFPVLCYRHRKNGMVSSSPSSLSKHAVCQLKRAAPRR